MRVLVTGGAGYVGSHACKALAAAGHEPIVYDNLHRGHRWAVKWGPFEHGDIGDAARVDQVLLKYRPDAIMHFAALAYVAESVVDPASYYHTNVAGTLTLLDSMRRNGIGCIVFSSSCASYGIPDRLPITEDHVQVPVNPYGRSKLAVETILKDYFDAYGLKSVALRYFNAAGADPGGEIGEEHDPETHLIPLVLRAAINCDEPIVVHGTDYGTRDGTCVRDYIHVSDLAAAHVLALDYLDTSAGFSAYNLGTGSGLTVHEIIGTAETITRRSIPVLRGPRRPGDPSALVADAALAQTDLGWSPGCSDIDTIISTAWAWLRRNYTT